MQLKRLGTAAGLTRTSALVAAALASACGEGHVASTQDSDDTRGVEEISSRSALAALVGQPTFNATTGAMSVPLGASDKLLIVSRHPRSSLPELARRPDDLYLLRVLLPSIRIRHV